MSSFALGYFIELLAPASSTVAVVLFLLPLFLLLRLKPALTNNTRLPPAPRKLPLIGNLHQIGSLPHQSLHTLAKKHGPLMLLQLGEIPTLIISSADMAREALKTHDLIFSGRSYTKTLSIILGGSYDMAFAPYGELWRQMRKICATHLLSARRVESYKATREEEAAHLIEKISQAVSTSSSPKPINMSQVLFFFANDLLCRVVLGKFSRGEGRNKLFREIIEETAALIGGFHVDDYFPSLGWLCSLLGLNGRTKRHARKWDNVLDKMIEDHLSRKEAKHEEDYDFVDVLLSVEKNPTVDFQFAKEHVKGLLLDMFAAGTDTTYITLEWALAELVRNPEKMKKLQDEVRRTATGKLMVEDKDLSSMSYLKAVLKETLRLHPPAPLSVPRETLESCQIEGYEIPKQARVLINLWAIARDPKFWEEPDEFRPERFLNSSIDFKGHYYQYIPFGAGRRICPGMNLAMSTAEHALANLVLRFDWELPDGMTAKDIDMTEAAAFTVRMKGSLHLVPKRF